MVESLVLRRIEADHPANDVRANRSARAETTPIAAASMVCLRRLTHSPLARMGAGGTLNRAACLRDRIRAQRAQTMTARLRTLLGLPAAFVTGGYISRTILRRCLRVFRLAASRALATHLYHNLHQPPRVAGAFLV